MQADPKQTALKVTGIHLLTLKYDEMLSTWAFNFNLRRYSLVHADEKRCAFNALATPPSFDAYDEVSKAAQLPRQQFPAAVVEPGISSSLTHLATLVSSLKLNATL